jgi:hypothetical protein
MEPPKVPHPEMPAWLPPAFTAPCRKPQADSPSNRKHHAGQNPSTFRELHGFILGNNVGRITRLFVKRSHAD